MEISATCWSIIWRRFILIIGKIPKNFEPEQIIEDWRAGAVQRSYTYRYLMTDREYHWLEMTVIKADDPETGDILGIAFCHSVDDENRWKNSFLWSAE